jgi:hypothetical protein
MTYLAKVSPRGPSCLAKISPQRFLLHHAIYRYSHTLRSTTKQGTLPKVILISQQAIPHQTHGGIVSPRGSTPKNWSLADSSKNHPQTMKVSTFPPYLDLAQTPASINYGSTHIAQDGRPQTIISQLNKRLMTQ